MKKLPKRWSSWLLAVLGGALYPACAVALPMWTIDDRTEVITITQPPLSELIGIPATSRSIEANGVLGIVGINFEFIAPSTFPVNRAWNRVRHD
jgi:hypothetical protein